MWKLLKALGFIIGGVTMMHNAHGDKTLFWIGLILILLGICFLISWINEEWRLKLIKKFLNNSIQAWAEITKPSPCDLVLFRKFHCKVSTILALVLGEAVKDEFEKLPLEEFISWQQTQYKDRPEMLQPWHHSKGWVDFLKNLKERKDLNSLTKCGVPKEARKKDFFVSA